MSVAKKSVGSLLLITCFFLVIVKIRECTGPCNVKMKFNVFYSTVSRSTDVFLFLSLCTFLTFFKNFNLKVFTWGSVPSAWSTSSGCQHPCRGHRPDDRPEWKCPRVRPRQAWIRQLEIDVRACCRCCLGHRLVSDRDVWRVQRSPRRLRGP